MAWYDTGTVSVTNGSATVTGSGTNFVAGAQVGEGFYGPDGRLYEIQAIVSATSLTLADNYLGSTQTGQAYKIVPTQSLVASLATQVSALISDFQGVVDEAGEGKFGDGLVTAPGITFLNDQDTGFYRDTPNEIGIAVTGGKVAEFNSTGMEVADRIGHLGDNTAIRFPANDTVTVETAGSERMRVTSAGNVGIGTSSPSTTLEVLASSSGRIWSPASITELLVERAGSVSLTLSTNDVGASRLNFANEASEARGRIQYDNPSDQMIFDTSGTEAMRITSAGNVAIGTTNPSAKLHVAGTSLFTGDMIVSDLTPPTTGLVYNGTANTSAIQIDSSRYIAIQQGESNNFWLSKPSGYSNGNLAAFAVGGTTVGTISTNGTITGYNTSSDYRLKDDIQPVTGASERLMALNPVNFAWLADGSRTDGFIAHEVQEVVPQAVTGEKDAVDEDGNPEYQGIDQSKLVPLLTAALQEAFQRIEALEAQLN